MKKLISLLCFLTLNSLYCAQLHGLVVSIHDGDTLTMMTDAGEKKKIRLVGIDTPEVQFNGHGQGDIAFAARDNLRDLIPLQSRILVEVEDYSLNHRRPLGTIYFNGLNINLTMVELGMAAPYIIAPFDKSLTSEYLLAAQRAYESKEGFLYSEEVMPYEFRMIVQNRHGTYHIGNKETKELFGPKEVQRVPYFQRIFFRSYEYAIQKGYKLQ